MKLTKYLSLVPYRIPINSSLLEKSAEEMLEQAGKLETLVEYLGWEAMPEELVPGFTPQKNGKEFINLLKENQKRKAIKSKRVSAGFQDLITPRKGLKGWVQKQFRDPTEAQLPLGYDAFVWLRESPRMALLTTLHDALLGYCSSAEPRRVEIEEVTEYQNAFCPVISKFDAEASTRVQKALGSSLKTVDPLFLIDYCPGYVACYNMQKGVAYYYGEPF
jgi:hypothetical protein